MRTEHEYEQGSPAWMAHRLQHFGASEAAAMLGISKRTTRNELLRAKATGLPKEFSDWVQEHLLDAGHAVEALARPLAEEIVGEDLFPVTMSMGRLSASTDGLTMANAIAWESKMWNEASAAIVREGRVPEEHMPQCQQVLMVTGAEKLMFSVTDGTRERFVYVWVLPDEAWFERIRAGWAQFEVDLALWVPPPAAAPAPIGKAPEMLPALRIEVTGAVTASNLAEFKATALEAIRSVNRELKTDEDFANADKAVKWCSDVESRLEAAKQHALSQTSTIDELFRTMDEIKAEARQVRLDLDKLVKARKDSVRGEIVTGAQQKLDDHVAALNQRLGTAWIPRQLGTFADEIKGKKSFTSMQDAVDAALANAKIAASALADRLAQNRKALVVEETDYLFLFADFAAVGQKPAEDFAAIAGQRIRQHQERTAVAAPPPAAAPAPAAVVRSPLPAPAAAAKPDTRPPITTGQLCERLPFTMQVEDIQKLGVQPLPKQPGQRGQLWAEVDYPKILAALIGRLEELYEQAVR